MSSFLRSPSNVVTAKSTCFCCILLPPNGFPIEGEADESCGDNDADGKDDIGGKLCMLSTGERQLS